MNNERGETAKQAPTADTHGPPAEESAATDYDRRGKPLPPKQRVGGIITPQ